MRRLLLSGAAILGGAITLAACHPVQISHHHHTGWIMGDHPFWDGHDDTPVTVAATLNCPEAQGDLTRTGAAADGKSCQYHGDEDEDVTLSLVSLNGQTPQAALAPLEAQLQGLVPARNGPSMVNIDAGHDDDDHNGDEGGRHDHAKIDLPGLHINANGDKADIRILGTDIKADGDKADIHTNMGMKDAVIHAGPGGAEIRAGEAGQHSAQLVYVLAGDNPGPSGYRAVGYMARGPVAGPLVVGQFKSKEGGRHGHDRDLQRLIDLNVTPAG